MRRENITDAEVEIEITCLKQSDAVRLAQKEVRLRNRRRQYMHRLRAFEKRGLALQAQGITFENIESKLFGDDPDMYEVMSGVTA